MVLLCPYSVSPRVLGIVDFRSDPLRVIGFTSLMSHRQSPLPLNGFLLSQTPRAYKEVPTWRT